MSGTERPDGLPLSLLNLIAKLVGGLGDDAVRVLDQAAEASVVSSRPTMVDLLVPAEVERIGQPDGPLPIRAFVLDSSGRDIGELLVWVRSGALIGLEQAWFTDEPPMAWPPVDRIRLT